MGEMMEFLVINKNKLKIMMTQDDMKDFEIDTKDIECDTAQNKKALWRVLDEANSKCDFSVSGDKVLIQFYPSSDGCELFVTKLGRLRADAEKSIARSQNISMLTSSRCIYRFCSIGDVLKLSRALSKENGEVVTDLYFSEDGMFYLVVEERCVCSGIGILERIGDFGVSVPYNMLTYIIEHSQKISQNGKALRDFASL